MPVLWLFRGFWWRAVRLQASRVIIRQAPMTDQPTIQPTITAIIAQVGMSGIPRAPRAATRKPNSASRLLRLENVVGDENAEQEERLLVS